MRRSGVKFLLVLSLGVSIKRTDVYSISVFLFSYSVIYFYSVILFIFFRLYLGEFEELDESITYVSLRISAFLHLRVYFISS